MFIVILLLIIVIVVVVAKVGLPAIYQWFASFLGGTHKLPLRLLGYEHIPAVPIQIIESIKTLTLLAGRKTATKPATYGLSNEYEIQGQKGTGYAFLYGGEDEQLSEDTREKLANELRVTGLQVLLSKDQALAESLKSKAEEKPTRKRKLVVNGIDLQDLFLEKPEQFTLSWTNYYDIYKKAQVHQDTWVNTLQDVTVANKEFWPTIANYGLAYNLLILEKVAIEQLPELKAEYGDDWNTQFDSLAQKGLLYAIDMTIYANVEAETVHGFTRFTPSTYTLLEQDATTKSLSPIAVWVANQHNANRTFFSTDANHTTKNAWLYALQAAKTSITVYGIWSGHVYHWHIVTAAMQMYFYRDIPKGHLLQQLLAPISNYLIAFDDVLLLLWKDIAPPTSIATSKQLPILMHKVEIFLMMIRSIR